MAWREPVFEHFAYWAFPENTMVRARSGPELSGTTVAASGLSYADVVRGGSEVRFSVGGGGGFCATAGAEEWRSLYATCSAADLILTWDAKDVPCGVAEFQRMKSAGLLPLLRPGGAEMVARAGQREIVFGGAGEMERATPFRDLLQL